MERVFLFYSHMRKTNNASPDRPKPKTEVKLPPRAEHPNRLAAAEHNEEMLFLDGFDDEIVGVANQFGRPTVAAYAYDAIIAKLISEGSTESEAIEHFEYNIIGGWVGETTPVFVTLLPGSAPLVHSSVA